MFLLFRKAWTYYCEGGQVHVDISDLDIVSPDDSVKMYAPDKIKVNKNGKITAPFCIVAVDDSEGNFSAMEYILFDEPVQTEYVKMTIQSVYKGNDYYSYDGDDGKACQDMGFDEIFVIH